MMSPQSQYEGAQIVKWVRTKTAPLRAVVAWNVIAQVAARLVTSVVAIFTLRLSTGYLGARSYGVLLTVMAFVTLFSTFTDWGLSTLAARDMARQIQDAPRVIGINLALRISLSVILIPIMSGIAALAYEDGDPRILPSVAIMSVSLLCTSAQAAVNAFFVAKVRNDLVSLISITGSMFTLALLTAVVHWNLGYYAVVWSNVIVAFGTLTLAVLIARRFVVIRPVVSISEWKTALLTAFPLGIVQIVNTIYYRVDTVILSFLRSPEEVGYYGVAYRLIDVVMSLPAFLMLALFPTLAQANAEQLRRLSQRAFDFMAIMAMPVFVGSLFVGRQAILLVASPNFLPGLVALHILMLGAAVSYFTAVFGNIIVAIGQSHRLVRLSIIVVSFNIVLNLTLIPYFGIAGAAIATATAEMVSLVVAGKIFVSATSVNLSLVGLLAPLAAVGCMTVVALLLQRSTRLFDLGPPPLLLLIAVLALAYMGTLLVCWLYPPLRPGHERLQASSDGSR